MGAREDPLATWDTMGSFFSTDHRIIGNLTGDGNLVKQCRDNIYRVCPGLAETWESSGDFTQWTFKIRDSVFWQDGTRFTAEDAKFWFDLCAFGATSGDKKRPICRFRQNLGDVVRSEVLEGNRLRITLRSPTAAFLDTLALPDQHIFHPRHLMQPRIDRGEVNIAPVDVGRVGTGPFRFVSYEKGTKTEVTRFDKYWEKDPQGRALPYLDGVVHVTLPDRSAHHAAFRTGRLDIGARGHFMSPADRAGYINDLGDRVWFARITGFMHSFSFNVLRPGPLQDVRVRRAILLAFDKQAAIDSVLEGNGKLYTLVNPTSPWPDPAFKTWPGWNPATREKDIAQAKQLLAEAGYAQGFTIVHPTTKTWLPRSEFIVGQLAKLGIELRSVVLDEAGRRARVAAADLDINLAGGITAPSPELGEPTLTKHSLNPGSGPKHEDEKVVELFRRMKAATTFDQRVKVYREMERYVLLEQAYVVPAYGEVEIVPIRSHVKGFLVPDMLPHANADLAIVWLDK